MRPAPIKPTAALAQNNGIVTAKMAAVDSTMAI
jgi:hypothetical protein